MSAEKLASRALWRVMWWRFVVALITAIEKFCEMCAAVLDDLSDSAFYAECDAARRYRLLTGVDLGVALGKPYRYMGVREEAWEEAVAEAESDAD